MDKFFGKAVAYVFYAPLLISCSLGIDVIPSYIINFISVSQNKYDVLDFFIALVWQLFYFGILIYFINSIYWLSLFCFCDYIIIYIFSEIISWYIEFYVYTLICTVYNYFLQLMQKMNISLTATASYLISITLNYMNQITIQVRISSALYFILAK